MTYHVESFQIELQDENGVMFEDEPFVGLSLPFKPSVGDRIMIRNTGGQEFEVMNVSYFAGIERGEFGCEFLGFSLMVRKLPS